MNVAHTVSWSAAVPPPGFTKMSAILPKSSPGFFRAYGDRKSFDLLIAVREDIHDDHQSEK
jgi:hypothetical protein